MKSSSTGVCLPKTDIAELVQSVVDRRKGQADSGGFCFLEKFFGGNVPVPVFK